MKTLPILTMRGIAFAICCAGLATDVPAGDASPSQPTSSESQDEGRSYTTRALRGRVVWMAEALSRRYAIRSVPEAAQRTLALETAKGQLVPLVEDVRGRAFRRDERLRDRKVELLVRQFEGSPFVQVIQVFDLRPDGKYELDYWCDICAIAMFELKACDCCQGEIELRARKVD